MRKIYSVPCCCSSHEYSANRFQQWPTAREAAGTTGGGPGGILSRLHYNSITHTPDGTDPCRIFILPVEITKRDELVLVLAKMPR